MDNKFTTVISYEKPQQQPPLAGSVILAGDVGALLKAIAFMLLWAIFTAALLIDPLMSNSNAANAANARQERVNFSVGVAPADAPASAHAATTTPRSTAQPAPATVLLKPNLNARPFVELVEPVEPAQARLSYALLSVK